MPQINEPRSNKRRPTLPLAQLSISPSVGKCSGLKIAAHTLTVKNYEHLMHRQYSFTTSIIRTLRRPCVCGRSRGGGGGGGYTFFLLSSNKINFSLFSSAHYTASINRPTFPTTRLLPAPRISCPKRSSFPARLCKSNHQQHEQEHNNRTRKKQQYIVEFLTFMPFPAFPNGFLYSYKHAHRSMTKRHTPLFC